MKFHIVVAMDRNRGIGYLGSLPWPKLKGDMKFYRDLTTSPDPGEVESRYGLSSGIRNFTFGSYDQFIDCIRGSKKLTKRKPDCFNAVIMGRRTWESLPPRYRPLPDRVNLVLTSKPSSEIAGAPLTARSLAEGLDGLAAFAIANTYIIGGGRLYREAIGHSQCGNLYLTEIFEKFECDVYFPDEIDGFTEMSAGHIVSERGIKYQFKLLSR